MNNKNAANMAAMEDHERAMESNVGIVDLIQFKL